MSVNKPYRECTKEEKERRCQYSRAYYARNKEILRVKHKEQQAKNGHNWKSNQPENRREIYRRHREKYKNNAEWKAERLAVKRAWEKKNRAENNEAVCAYHNAWLRRKKEKDRESAEAENPAKKMERLAREREFAREPDFIKRDAERRTRKRVWLKESVIDKYGGHCACCGEDNLAFLTIDHINNDGNAWRKQNSSVSTELYRILRKEEGLRSDLQVLCCNCNIAKYRYGVCPHQTNAEFIVRRGVAA